MQSKPQLDLTPFTTKQTSWAPFNLQIMMASAPWGSADLGESELILCLLELLVAMAAVQWLRCTHGWMYIAGLACAARHSSCNCLPALQP